jgi:hypothetical protein
MQAIILQTGTSFHVANDVSDCLDTWGGSLIVKSGNATSDVSGIGLAHVEGNKVSPSPLLGWITSLSTERN